MRAKRISSDEQLKLITECRQSGLSDYQWCQANGINPGTFYNWISRLRKRGDGYSLFHSGHGAGSRRITGSCEGRPDPRP